MKQYGQAYKYLERAKTKEPENKSLNRQTIGSVYYEPKEVHDLLKEFEGNYRQNMEVHKEIRNENNNFLNNFHNANKQIALKKDSAFEIIFSELLMKYKQKGHNAHTDFTNKNNLFETSPLLIENKRIVDYFKLGDNYNLYLKDCQYLKRIKGWTNEIFLNGAKKLSSSAEKVLKNRIEPEKVNLKKIPIRQVIKEIEINEQKIKDAEEILEKDELKNIFCEFKENVVKSELPKQNLDKTADSIIRPRVKSLGSTKSGFLKNLHLKVEVKHKSSRKNYSVNEDKSRRINNSSNVSQIEEDTTFPELSRVPLTSIKKKPKKTTATSLFSLMKKEINIKSSPNITKRKKKMLTNEFNFNYFIDEEKKEMKDDIDEKLNNNKNPELERIRDRILSNDASNKEIIDYLVDKVGRDRTILEEGLKKKLGPTDIMKYIADIKSKVAGVDFNESYKNFTAKMGLLDINQHNLAKIR